MEALRDLPHRQRDCLALRYYHELPVDEIAATLGLSANSVKTHLQAGLRGPRPPTLEENAMSALEDRLHDALGAEGRAPEPSPDLFARVVGSIDDDRAPAPARCAPSPLLWLAGRRRSPCRCSP